MFKRDLRIACVAPSGAVNPDSLQRAINRMGGLGVYILVGSNVYAQHRYLAGTVEQRISDLKWACLEPSIDAIWCARGGFGAAALLPHLGDWIKNKPIIGYSDNSALLNYVAKIGGTAIHGPVIQEAGAKSWPFYASKFMHCINLIRAIVQSQPLTLDYAIRPYANQADVELEAKVYGGNLTTVASTLGSEYQLNRSENHILLLEEVNEPYYKIERLFLQLMQHADPAHLKAVVLGEFYRCDARNSPHSLMQILAEHLDLTKTALFKSQFFGHGGDNAAFPLAQVAQIKQNQLRFQIN